MKVPFFDLRVQTQKIKDQLLRAIEEVVDDTGFILGPRVEQFEKLMAEFCRTRLAVGVASGTDALHLALLASGVGPGDEVITPPFSFIATAEAISYIGARPVFVDVDEGTFNINADLIEEKITSKTKAILPVHLYGQPADMSKIRRIAEKHSLKIVEDCAQSIGAKINDQIVGSLGDAGCFSFFPTKNLGCFGDGGMVVTSSQEIYQKVKMLRSHGGINRDDYEILGFNSRLDVLQAVILELKLKYLDEWTQARRKHAADYNNLLKGLPLATPFELKGSYCVYNQYTIKSSERDRLMEYLRSNDIGCMVYYPKSIHLQKIYQNQGSLPVSEKIQNEVLSLPIYPELTRLQIETVAGAIRKFYQK